MTLWSLRSGKTRIDFSHKNGSVAAIYFDGAKVVALASELFSCRLRSSAGTVTEVSGSDFTAAKFDENGFSFNGCNRCPGLRVEVAVRSEAGNFYFRPKFHDIPGDLKLELIDVPQIVIGANRDLFHPRSEGGIIFQPGKKNYVPPEIDHGEFYIDNYPGRCQMQFMAAYRNGRGVYFAAHDPEGTPKRIIYSGVDGSKRVRLRLETFCGNGNAYVSPFEYVVGGFAGDWMDACDIYRDWAEKAFGLQAGREIPEWMKDSPVTLIYPVCGDGTIKAEPNQYFPYVNGMKYVKKFAVALDSRIMALLMRWDKNGPWLPPEIWPPLGGEAMLAEYRDQLHAAGHLLGLYGSGTAWTLKSHTNGYDASEEFRRKRLDKVMCKNMKGEIHENVMIGIRNGYYMCMAEDYPRNMVKTQIREMAKFGLDFLQFFDQNLGCNNYLCCAKDHNHPEMPGVWSTRSMRTLLTELNAELRAAGSPMILGTEGAAAEPYVAELPFNDLRSSLYFGDRPVPACQYVFHQYCHDFMGNQVHMTHCLDLKKSPDNLLFRIAYSFNSGAMLSIPMRENGLIDWGNDGDWTVPPPDQKSALALLKRLNTVRRAYPEIFLHGRMVRPRITFDGGEYVLYHKRRKIVFDRVLTSGWLTPAGVYAQLLLNFLPEARTLSGIVPQHETMFRNGKQLPRNFKINLPPLSVTVINNSVDK